MTEIKYHFVKPETIKEANPLSFVGPKPKPVTEPTVVLPFKVEGRFVRDANGDFLFRVNGRETAGYQDRELAKLIARLLNAHFGVAAIDD